MTSSWLVPTLICLAASVASVEGAYMPVPWVFTDPKHDPYNPLQYIVNNTLTAIAMSLVLSVAVIHTWLFWRYGGRCMLSMLIGELTWAVGFGIRFSLHSDPDDEGKYIACYLFIVLSPCAFIASEYMLMGRLARYIKSDEHLLIPPQCITIIFVLSDIVTFIVQATGAIISVSKNQKLSKIGECIFLTGLALQLLSFGVFVLVALRFIYRVKTLEPRTWALDTGKAWHQDWRMLSSVLIVSSVSILIRCMYRAIELSQGYRGHLATTEAYFYALDSLPLLVAVAVYTPFWPARMMLTIDELANVDHIGAVVLEKDPAKV